MKKLIFILISLLDFACAPGFGYKKQIIGKYYLLGVDDTKDIHVVYKLENGDFIGKIPGVVSAYGTLRDTLIIAKIYSPLNLEQFYILDINKDSEYAKSTTAISGPMNATELYIKIPNFRNLMVNVK